ncbi:MAG: XrtA/PEP-CTERM system TPR-repeat protein PrsT [Pseudomonadota bacterium]
MKNTWRAAAAATSAALLLGVISGCGKTQTAEAMVAEAKQFQQKGENAAALIQLKNALAKNPELAEARYLLALAEIEVGDALAAEKEVRKALSLGYPSAQATPLLARTLLAQGQFQKVIDETQEAAKQGAPELLCLRADAYLAIGKREQAQELYDAALRAKPNDATAQVGQARLAYLARDVDGALTLAQRAVEAEPKNAEAWLFKGDLLRAQNKPELALAAYDQVLVIKPAHRSAHIEKAYLEISTGKFEAAQADLNAARKSAPSSLMVTYTQALLDFTQGKNAAAQESLQKVLRAAPEHMPSILLAGAVDLSLGSMQQAEQHLKKYLEKNPGNLYARKMLATTLLRGGQTPDALAVLAPALKNPQPDVQLLALAGESYMQARDFNKATEYFEKASVLEPKAAALRTSLGLSRLGSGDPTQAISELELATALDTKSLPAGTALVRAEIGLKHYDKALAAATSLEKAQPDNPVVQDLKGAAYVGKADMAAARASFDKALVLQPSYYPALANLVQLDMIEKKPDAAKQRLTAFLALDPKSIDAMTALAGLAASQGQAAEASDWLEKASAAHPDAVAPAIRLAVQYLRSGQQRKALTLARKFQIANPANLELLDLLGQAQLANGDASDAVETYNKLASAAPKAALAQFRLASAYIQVKNPSAASDSLKKAVALQPDYLEAQLAQVDMAMRAGQVEPAVAIARQIQKQRPKAPVGWMLEGDLLLQQKKIAPALALYEQALGLSSDPALKIKVANAMQQAGQGAQARQRMVRWAAEAQAPAAPVLKMYLAEGYLAGAQYPAAIEQLQAVLQAQPNNVGALNNLAWAYQQVKDGRALATAEQAVKLAANNPAVIDTLGWVLVEQGNTARGVPLLQQAATLGPAATDIHYHLAYGFYKAGNKAQARKELESLLGSGKAFPQADEARALLKQL